MKTVSIETTGGHQAMDYPQHVSTYNLFLRLAKVGTVLCIAILAGMYFFLV